MINGMDSKNQFGANLAYTKFIFITPRQDDDAARTRVREAGGVVGRGFFNDFDADGTRLPAPHETIQFLTAINGAGALEGIGAARYVIQVSAKYRARLEDVEAEIRRRLRDHAQIDAIEGALRTMRYTSTELHSFAYKPATCRVSGRVMRNAIIIPVKKSNEWWALDPLDRHIFFYPHTDPHTGARVKGHARAAEAGVRTIYRQLYHNPDGYRRDGEYDFVAYFECPDEELATFDQICQNLRDQTQNPEWNYVSQETEWRGRRAMRW